MKARPLKTIAKFINENLSSYGYLAKVEKSHCDTDRMYGRLRYPGKGRDGLKLIVSKNQKTIFSHNSAETYRRNREVEYWLEKELSSISKSENPEFINQL